MRSELELGGAYLYALWADAELPDGELARFNDFYSDVHLAEVLRYNPGFVTAMRGEVAARHGAAGRLAAGGYASARYVALYGVADELGMATYLRRDAGTGGERPRYSSLPSSFPGPLAVRGRAFYRRTAVATSGSGPTAVAVLAGTGLVRGGDGDPAPAAHEPYRGLPPRALSSSGFHRASWFVLARNLNRPDGNSPRALAVYEAGPAAASGCLRRYRSLTRRDSGTADTPVALAYRLLRIRTLRQRARHDGE